MKQTTAPAAVGAAAARRPDPERWRASPWAGAGGPG
jgi:hypothetical protein